MPIVHELPHNTYDTAGNIRQVKQGSTVTGSYTYGNGDWRDLLTAYNNQPIALRRPDLQRQYRLRHPCQRQPHQLLQWNPLGI